MLEYLIVLVLSIISAVFATAVMSYISMAVPIGPWIDVTLVLLISICTKLLVRTNKIAQHRIIALCTAAGGIAGIAATGCAFSFPTLYFLDKALFNIMLAQPLYFCAMTGMLVFLAGGLGLIMAQLLEKPLVSNQELSFPVGTMVQKIIVSQDQARKGKELLAGSMSTLGFLLLQQPFAYGRSLIPKIITLHSLLGITPSFVVQVSLLPMLVSIGFIAGHLIAIPLVVGAVTKSILEPLHMSFFAVQTWNDFILAFCSGMVLQGVLWSLSGLTQLFTVIKKNSHTYTFNRAHMPSPSIGAAALGLSVLYGIGMSYIGMPILAQLFLLVGTIICSYQLAFIGGKIGLAPLGRFATFVMVPGVMLFGNIPLLATVLATFVEIAGGVTVDALFGYKTASLLSVDNKQMRAAQWIGLIAASLSIGVIFYLLITHLHLGSEQLFAQKAQTRALLLHFHTFNLVVLGGGFVFGMILKQFKLNPMFVLTGILMPLDYSLGLIAGGMLARTLKDTDRLTPFFSGAFCVNSLWIMLEAFLLRNC